MLDQPYNVYRCESKSGARFNGNREDAMLVGLLISVAVVGQQATYLGRADNVLALTVATNEAVLRINEIDLKGRNPDAVTQPVGIAVVAYGTRVRVLRDTTLEVWGKSRLRTTPGLWIEILDGPLAGSRVVTSARSTHEGPSSRAVAVAPVKPTNKAVIAVWLGGPEIEGVHLAPIVATSLDEIAGVDILPGEIDAHGVKTGPAPLQAAQLGYGTRAEVYEIVPFRSRVEGEAPDQHAALVRILDGPAAGRYVYVDMRDVLPGKPEPSDAHEKARR
jgi:hypothetical protein